MAMRQAAQERQKDQDLRGLSQYKIQENRRCIIWYEKQPQSLEIVGPEMSTTILRSRELETALKAH